MFLHLHSSGKSCACASICGRSTLILNIAPLCSVRASVFWRCVAAVIKIEYSRAKRGHHTQFLASSLVFDEYWSSFVMRWMCGCGGYFVGVNFENVCVCFCLIRCRSCAFVISLYDVEFLLRMYRAVPCVGEHNIW